SYCLEKKLIDYSMEILEGAKLADIIILATPVDAILEMLPKMMDIIEDQVIVDMGSTKKEIIDLASKHPKRQNFVAAHPMAALKIPDLQPHLANYLLIKSPLYVVQSKMQECL
ncbi:MAG: prephenate dehydrogenase/arogenate dehydrogenase family protein, partial [Bacteroidota bacterium]